jgi:hypothetical protein
MKPIHAVTAILAIAVLSACSHSRGPAPSNATARRDADVITAEELSTITATTIYEAVRVLRPAWLMRSRPTAIRQQQQAQLIVYIDGTRYGNMESLRQIVPSGVFVVRYYSPGEAEGRFGPGHLLGAIEVITRGH